MKFSTIKSPLECSFPPCKDGGSWSEQGRTNIKGKNLCPGNKKFTQRWCLGEIQDQKPDHKGLRDIDKAGGKEKSDRDRKEMAQGKAKSLWFHPACR